MTFQDLRNDLTRHDDPDGITWSLHIEGFTFVPSIRTRQELERLFAATPSPETEEPPE